MSKLRGNRTLTGTWGEIWVDGELIAELSKIEVKVSATVRMCSWTLMWTAR